MWKASGTVTVDSDKEYHVQAQVDKDIKDRKDFSAKLKPSLLVTSPDGTLLSVMGGLDYRQNKMLKTNLVVDMKDVLKKPVSLDCESWLWYSPSTLPAGKFTYQSGTFQNETSIPNSVIAEQALRTTWL